MGSLTVTVDLPSSIESTLEEMTRERGSVSQLVSDAVEEYAFSRQFRSLRDRMTPKAEAQDVFCDEDVFARVS